MKAVVAAFNQEKALVGAFSVIVQPVVEPMNRFAALVRMVTSHREPGTGCLVLVTLITQLQMGADRLQQGGVRS